MFYYQIEYVFQSSVSMKNQQLCYVKNRYQQNIQKLDLTYSIFENKISQKIKK